MAYGLAATGVVPTKQWIADCLRAAQQQPSAAAPPAASSAAAAALLDGASASRLCYALHVWGCDPGKAAAAWLLAGAAEAALSPGDAAVVLLGAAHLGVQGILGEAGGGHVSRAWLEGFVDRHVLSLLPSMDGDALASCAAALPGLSSAIPRRREVLETVEAAVANRMTSGEMGAEALTQVAVQLYRIKHRPGSAWIEQALTYAQGIQGRPGGGAKAIEWLNALAKL